MGRYSASNRSGDKNKGRNELFSIYNQCITTERPKEWNPPTVIFIDGLQCIKNISPAGFDVDYTKNKGKDEPAKVEIDDDEGFEIQWAYEKDEKVKTVAPPAKENNISTYKDVVDILKGSIIGMIMKSKAKGKITVIFGVDKYKNISLARTVVHSKKKMTKSELAKIEVAENIVKKDGYKNLDEYRSRFQTPLLTDQLLIPISQIMEDKNNASETLIRFLSYHLFSAFSGLILPGLELSLIIDGHCITPHWPGCNALPFSNQAFKEMNELSKEMEMSYYNIPLRMDVGKKVMSLGNEQRSSICYCTDCHNVIGEADYLPFFYANTYCELVSVGAKNPTIELHVNDSDAIFCGIIYHELVNSKKERKVTVNVSSTAPGSDTKWINIEKLANAINTDKKLKTLSNPALQLIVSCIIAGCDYMEKTYYVPHQHWIAALMKYSKEIGDVVNIMTEGDWLERCSFRGLGGKKIKVNGGSFYYLMCRAYLIAFDKMFGDTHHFPDFDKTYDYKWISETIKMKSSAVDKWFPLREDIALASQQLQYYMDMLSFLGQSDVDRRMNKHDLRDYGYCDTEGRTSKKLVAGRLQRKILTIDHAEAKHEREELLKKNKRLLASEKKSKAKKVKRNKL